MGFFSSERIAQSNRVDVWRDRRMGWTQNVTSFPPRTIESRKNAEEKAQYAGAVPADVANAACCS